MTQGSEARAATSPGEEARRLRDELRSLLDKTPAPAPRIELIERYYGQAFELIENVLPRLCQVRLPVSGQTRQAVLRMQGLLEMLAGASLTLIESPHGGLLKSLGTPVEVALWRVLHGQSRQLLLANLIATPPAPGVWLQVHRAYLAVRAHRLDKKCPAPGSDLQGLYARIVVLGALPCAALTAQQWGFAHRLLAQTRAVIALTDTPPVDAAGALWLSPELDMPPIQLSRRTPSGEALTLYVDIAPLVAELESERAALASGEPGSGHRPGNVSPRAARITLTNLLRHLAHTRKRRFPRRRQSYRATLCCGLTTLWDVLNGSLEDDSQVSEWMVVNESPDGFAAMHVSGRPQKVQVGDLVGLRRDDQALWSVCIVRWALSENPEHLELGLQMLAPKAMPGRMATPGVGSTQQRPTLLLPATPPVRPLDALAFLPSDHPAPEQKHLLVLHTPKTEIRQFLVGEPLEQSTSVDICLIHADTSI
jgi:cyclic-di-GMP-binding protein